jgi:hypothetical protein
MDREQLPEATDESLPPEDEQLESQSPEPEEEEPEPPAPEGEEEEERPAAPLSASQQRIQREIEKRRMLEASLEQERRSRAYWQSEANRRASQVDPNERQRRLDAMEPHERFNYLLAEERQANRENNNRIEYMVLAQNDAFQFQTYLARHPEFRKYELEIENLFNQALANGQPQSRNALLSWRIGERVRERADQAVGRARKAGVENIKRVVTKPVSSRSNVGAGERKPMTAEERLRMNLERGAYVGQT